MTSPEKPVPVGKRFYEMLKDDTIGYFSEYRCGSIDPTAIAAAAAALSVEVNGHDVVVLAKRGCGACAAASALLADAAAKTPFSLQRRVIADDPIAVAAAEAALGGAWAKTFPIIFVRGVYVGGRDELVAMEGRGALATALAAERAPFSAGKAGDANALSDDVKAMLAPSLFKAPKGGPWARFQWYMFANVVRGQSAAHLLLFAILMALEPGSPLTMIISFLMILDLLATILIGCAPLAPIGAAATRALWTRRGPAVHSVPYKIVYALYLLRFVSALKDGSSPERGSLFSMLGNSLLLAVFRLWPSTLVTTILVKSVEYARSLLGCCKRGGGASLTVLPAAHSSA